jgi:hypothetical protein
MDVTGTIELPEGVEMVMPGDNVNLLVELITPVALEKGSKFAIREGGLTVGAWHTSSPRMFVLLCGWPAPSAMSATTQQDQYGRP